MGSVTPRGTSGSMPKASPDSASSSGTSSPVRPSNKNGLRLKKLPPVQFPMADRNSSAEEAAPKVKLNL